jgi:hypothetical protein
MYRLPEALRAQLARPLGPVLKAEEALRQAAKARFLVTIGDVTTATFLKEGLRPRVMVVDNRTKRGSFPAPVRETLPPGTPVLQAPNPPARITEELWQACASALSAKEATLVEVQGEEDLAALPCVLLAPTGAVVAYGQPDEGIVLIHVDDAARERVRSILKQMEGP